MSMPISCGVCGVIMEHIYDKRIKYCTPACASIAKRHTMEKWNADHKKEHICQHCFELIECCGSRQRKYHPECAIIVNKKNKSPYNKHKQEELKEYSQINKITRDRHVGSEGYIENTSYDGFTNRKVSESKGDISAFVFPLINERYMDRICKDIEALCV